MSRSERLISNSVTHCVEEPEITYESLDSNQGFARLIRFRLRDEEVRFGDTLAVVRDGEILFHGLVRAVDPAGWGAAMDLNSKMPVPVRTGNERE